MKTILLPTDFSKSAKNAIEYAMKLHASKENKFIMYHSYLVPNVGPSYYSPLDTVYHKQVQDVLMKEKTRIDKKYGTDIMILTSHNTLYVGVKEVIEKHKVDEVVMGTTGSSGIDTIFFGSNTVDVIDNVDVPVLVIPEKSKHKALKNIIFCADYEKLNHKKTLSFVKDLVVANKSKLKILHIKSNPYKDPPKEHLIESTKEAEFFKPEVDVDFKVVLGEDVEKGINWYIENHKDVNMLVVVNHHKGFFGKLFSTNHAHELAYHTKLPLLILQSK